MKITNPTFDELLDRLLEHASSCENCYQSAESVKLSRMGGSAAPTRNSEVLASFVRYCQENPEHRFWQALRNWSGYHFILTAELSDEKRMDTFNWEGRRHDG